MKILIVDDDAVSRRLLQGYLQKWGHTVTAAADGNEAWQLFAGGDFPVVISDWMMPGMDGPELVRRIRASDRAGYVYIILLTARSQKEDVVEGMEAGADDFVTKPFDRDELRVRLRAGERLMELERNLAERNRALDGAQLALSQYERFTSLGRRALQVLQDVEDQLTDTMQRLVTLEERISLSKSAPPAGPGECSEPLLEAIRRLQQLHDDVQNFRELAELDAMSRA